MDSRWALPDAGAGEAVHTVAPWAERVSALLWAPVRALLLVIYLENHVCLWIWALRL